MRAFAVLAALAAISIPASCTNDDVATTSKPAEWAESGVCGEVFFWAASADGSQAVTVNATSTQDLPRTMAFSLPDPRLTVEVLEGEGLDEYFCADLPTSGSNVASTTSALTATGTIDLDPPDGPCYEVTGRLSITDLTTEDGKRYPNVSIVAPGVGCVSG